MVVEAVGGWLSGSAGPAGRCGAHADRRRGAGPHPLHRPHGAASPNDTKTYGYLRLEILAALVNGALLFVIAGLIVLEAIHRVRNPAPIQGGLFLAVAAAGLLVNAVGLRLLHRDREHHLNTRGAYLHILGDLLGSVGALIAAVILLTTGWTPADPIISVLIAVLILGGAWRLVRESTDILLEAVPGHVSMPEVQRRMLAVPGVSAVHDLHVWTVTSGMVAMSGHAVVPRTRRSSRCLERIREAMGDLGIGHVTVQLEMGEDVERRTGRSGRTGRTRQTGRTVRSRQTRLFGFVERFQ